MDESAVGEPKQRAGRTSRVGLAVLVALAAGFGFWGLHLATPAPPGAPVSFWTNLLYQDLQLFVLQPPPLPAGVTPSWQLEIGRFLAPATTVFAVFVAASEAFRDQLRWLWRRRVRGGYAVVVGATAEARAVAHAKRAQKAARVHEIPTGDLSMLKTAGIKKAALTLYACADDRTDVTANLAIALTAAAGRSDRPLRINVQVTDPALARGLKARRLMAARSQQPVVEFFTMDEMAARTYVAADPIVPGARPEILVAGAGAFGRAVVVAIAQQWRAQPEGAPKRVTVTLVDREATRIRRELMEGWPVVDTMCSIGAFDVPDLGTYLRENDPPTPYRSYLCYEDEHDALRAALTAVNLWRGGPASIVVRLSRLAQHGQAFADQRLDHIGDRLRVANVAVLAADLVACDPDPVRDLAEDVHRRYLDQQLAMGKRLGSQDALKAWSELDEGYRESNRAQVRDFPAKLTRIGCTVAPRTGYAAGSFDLRPDEVELLAREEHERWMAERTGQGWTYGRERNNKKKRHPDLVPWDELPDASRDKDRDAARNLLLYDAALGEVGLQIVRLTPESVVVAV